MLPPLGRCPVHTFTRRHFGLCQAECCCVSYYNPRLHGMSGLTYLCGK
jgi:hypothetical protein